MAFYNRDNVPAERPLGLDEDKLSDRDKAAHEQMRKDMESNLQAEQEALVQTEASAETSETNLTENSTEIANPTTPESQIKVEEKKDAVVAEKKQSWFRRLYDRIRDDLNEGGETAQGKGLDIQERAGKAEQKGEKLNAAKKELKLLQYEIHARKNPQEFKSKDESPITAEDIKNLKGVLERHKERAKYNGLKYPNIEGLEQKFDDPEAMQVALDGISKMDKASLPPEDLATINNIEHRFKGEIKHHTFEGVAELIGKDTSKAYTPAEMRLFLSPPKGGTMSKESAMEALQVLHKLEGFSVVNPKEMAVLAKAEKTIREMGNLPKGNKFEKEKLGIASEADKKSLSPDEIRQHNQLLEKYENDPTYEKVRIVELGALKRKVDNKTVQMETLYTIDDEDKPKIDQKDLVKIRAVERRFLFEQKHPDQVTDNSSAEEAVAFKPKAEKPKTKKETKPEKENTPKPELKPESSQDRSEDDSADQEDSEEDKSKENKNKKNQSKEVKPIEVKETELSEKQVLFEKIGDLLRKDLGHHFSDQEARVFLSPDNTTSMDMVTAELGLSVLEKLRTTWSKKVSGAKKNLELLDQAEDMIRQQAGMKNRKKI